METQFFNELQKHSEAKLQILNQYVIPWMRKIVLGPYRKCLVIDGFAGQGKYGENGADGSPLILLKSAIDFCNQSRKHGWKDPEIFLIFIEGLEENYEKLKANIKEVCGLEWDEEVETFFQSVPGYPSLNVSCLHDEFHNVLSFILDEVKQLIPSFCFIDPFGFSQTPFEVIERYMQNEKAEMLLNFIYEETNRFLKYENEKIQEHISRHFGVESLEELKTLIGETKGSKRKEIIVDYYSRQLKEQANVKYVLNFEIKKNGRTKLILFFGTKSLEGLKLMKEVMWKVDETGSYLYDDRKNPSQIKFAFAKDLTDEQTFRKIAECIEEVFAGTKKNTFESIERYVLAGTIFPGEKYVRGALRILEESGKIQVSKINGEKRRPFTYKNVYINFR
ncbi:three-Cys-motif partner protein TcmP [Brevibacillus thermoruber]|uniref:three-Cys-motif partner protein TcmP n=1 Tax=Brevibacillus thermoruber TaxID=33942 RepID=UPI004042FB44